MINRIHDKKDEWGGVYLMSLFTLAIALSIVGLMGKTVHAACAVPPAGLVSWWPAEGNAKDIVIASGNNGTLEGGTTFAAGMVGQAFSFDGVDDYVDLGNNDIFNFKTQDFTIELWVSYNSIQGEQVLVEKFSGMTGPGWSFTKLSSQVYRFAGGGCTGAGVSCVDSGPISLLPNTWYHLAVSRNNNVFTIYLNGNSIGSRSDYADLQTNDPLLIGRRNPGGWMGFFMNGLIDEVAIYNRALTVEEIQAIYAAGSAGKCKCNGLGANIVGTEGNDTLTGWLGLWLCPQVGALCP